MDIIWPVPRFFFANVFTLLCLLALLYVKGRMRPAEESEEYATVRRKVGGCIGCGRCNIGCPLIVEYREKNPERRQNGRAMKALPFFGAFNAVILNNCQMD